MTAMVEISDLTLEYRAGRRSVVALQNVDLQVDTGEFISLLGPSGCGKTTLLRILAGLLPHTSGQVHIDGEPLSGHMAGVGIVFQRPVLLPWRTVVQNILLPIELAGRITPAHRSRATELLAMVGLADFAGSYPSELSGGMQQRVAICRALIHEPRVLLMDEPFGALDAMTRDSLNVQLNRIWRETGTTVMLITHSISEAVFLSQRVIVMGPRPGRIIDEIDVPLADERTLDVLGDAEFTRLCAQVRSHFEAEVEQ